MRRKGDLKINKTAFLNDSKTRLPHFESVAHFNHPAGGKIKRNSQKIENTNEIRTSSGLIKFAVPETFVFSFTFAINSLLARRISFFWGKWARKVLQNQQTSAFRCRSASFLLKLREELPVDASKSSSDPSESEESFENQQRAKETDRTLH